MPLLPQDRHDHLPDTLASDLLERAVSTPDPTLNEPTLVERVNIPYNSSTAPQALIQAETVDPFSNSGKYALAWVYFCIILLVFAFLIRLNRIWTDKIRTATQKDRLLRLGDSPILQSPGTPYEMSSLNTDRSTSKLFPRGLGLKMDEEDQPSDKIESTISSFSPLNQLIALFRYVLYQPSPRIRWAKKRWIEFPSWSILLIVIAALTLTVLYCFVPQPLYWQSIQFGSPPIAIRSGMMAVAMMPWLVALSMKANSISMITGVGHERLNVLHRWGGWLCLFLSLVHTVPFYLTPVWDKGGYAIFRSFFNKGIYVYGTGEADLSPRLGFTPLTELPGVAALVPLIFLCVHSLPFFRHAFYELFVVLHVPAAIVFLAMMFWHCNDYLTSWNYLFATLAIWLLAYLTRLFYLNWTNPRRMSWLIGEEAGVYLLPENAVKITIPTQVKWSPGQYVYLRMPGISAFENHPFTIASLCSNDFPSEYGEHYRDMILVFRPFSGFTKKVLDKALEKGPWHSYRAFLDGPYGGMTRDMASFDHVVLVAGGSGITATISHLLDLIKRMRDGKATTRQVQIIWAIKRPETLEWFKEELRICREFAPPDTVACRFYITAAKRLPATGQLVSASTPSRVLSGFFHDRVNGTFQDIANKRQSHLSELSAGTRHSALIREEAAGDPEKETELRREREDGITALPHAQIVAPPGSATISQHSSPEVEGQSTFATPAPVRSADQQRRRAARERNLSLDIQAAARAAPGAVLSPGSSSTYQPTSGQPLTAASGTTESREGGREVDSSGPGTFDFGFPSTPTEFQKNLMRFAFLPGTADFAIPGRSPHFTPTGGQGEASTAGEADDVGEGTAAAATPARGGYSRMFPRNRRRDGWTTEYGRPDVKFMLRRMGKDFVGKRACVFVCGPPGMRRDVQSVVAEMQGDVLRGKLGRRRYSGDSGSEKVEEVFLHTENYSI